MHERPTVGGDDLDVGLHFFVGVAAGKSVQFWIEFQVNPTNVGHRSQNVELDDGPHRLFTVHRTITIYP